jgi:hypothetical protein
VIHSSAIGKNQVRTLLRRDGILFLMHAADDTRTNVTILLAVSDNMALFDISAIQWCC